MSKKYHGYTIWEMLLIVLVLSLLAIALVLTFRRTISVARDAARVSDLSELTNVFTAYYLDYNRYPSTGILNVNDDLPLSPEYVLSVPMDPREDHTMNNFTGIIHESGDYVFVPDDNESRGTMMVIAKMETDQLSNYHVSGPFSGMVFDPKTIDWRILQKNMCTKGMYKVDEGEASANDPCAYEDPESLRHIIIKHNY